MAGAAAAAMAAAGVAQAPAERAPAPSFSVIVAESLAPLLASWIVASRDAAIAQGVEPIPAPIREALTGYVPESVLDRVRWRHDNGELSLPEGVLRFGEVPAMTLDDVILFQAREVALEDPKLWAHELRHVMQFEEWGVDGFARRYLSDYEAVEHEAAEFRWQFMKQAGLIPRVTEPE